MSFKAQSSGGDFVRHFPKMGVTDAVIADVVDIGIQQVEYQGEVKDQAKITIIWEIDQDHPELDGPFRIYKTVTNSLHEKATLTAILEGIRGKAYTDDERKEGVDLDKLVGVPCQLVLQKATSKAGNEYTKIAAFMPAGEKKLAISEHYAPSLKESYWISAFALKNGAPTSAAEFAEAAVRSNLDDFREAVAAAQDDDLPF